MSTFKEVLMDGVLRNDGLNAAMYRTGWNFKLALVYLPFLDGMSLLYISEGRSAIMNPMITAEDLDADDWVWHRMGGAR